MSGNTLARIVGTAIGYYFGGPFGGAIGGLIGGALVQDQLPDKTGPRLTDLKPQSSEYGRPIPIVYGTIALGGNVIWAAPLFELSQTTSEGGKGSGPTQNTINYSYYAYFAVAICEGERDIGRIWAGPEKRLVYDGDGFVEGGDFGFGAVRVYRGTEDQLPDPLLEFYLGVGNVPAYRGTCYVVFQNFPVVNDGNRIPFLWAEVGTAGESPPPRGPVYLGNSAHPSPDYTPIHALVDGAHGDIWSVTPMFLGSTLEVRVNSDVTMTQIASFSIAMPASFTVAGVVYEPGEGGDPGMVIVIGEEYGTFVDKFVLFDASTSIPVYYGMDDGTYHGTASLQSVLYNPADGQIWGFRYGGTFTTNLLAPHSFFDEPQIGDTFGLSFGTIWPDVAILAGAHIAVGVHGTTNAIILLDNESGVYVTKFDIGSSPPRGLTFYDSVRNRVIVGSSTGAMTFKVCDCNTGSVFVDGTVTDHTFSSSADADTTPAPSEIIVSAVMVDGHYIFGSRAEIGKGTTLYIVDPDTFETLHTYTYEAYDPAKPYLMTNPLLVPLEDKPYIFSFDQLSVKRLYFKSQVAMTGQTLASVVSDLSVRAGLTVDDIDVDELTDIVDGYAITQQTAVRQAIDPLRSAYYFDAVESGEIVKFVKRGGSLVREIQDADLAACRAGEEAAEPLSTTRQMEVELPKKVSVNYLLAATKYTQATKEAERQIGSSQQPVTLDLPLVLNDTKAQEVAEVNLHVAWTQRLNYTFDLGLKHSELEPTDIVMVKGNTMRITKVVDTPYGVRHVSAVRDASHYYQPHVIVTETAPVIDEVFVPDETVLELM